MQAEYLARFNSTTFRLIESLSEILGSGSFYVTNGASLFYRLATLGIDRIPTDLDIVAPGLDLQKIQKELHKMNLDSIYDPHPVQKWGLTYNEPQLRGEIDGIPYDLVAKSTIVKANGTTLVQHEKSSPADWVVDKNVWIPVAKLETVKQAKEFQLRPHPKQDISDLEHIQLLIAMELS